MGGTIKRQALPHGIGQRIHPCGGDLPLGHRGQRRQLHRAGQRQVIGAAAGHLLPGLFRCRQRVAQLNAYLEALRADGHPLHLVSRVDPALGQQAAQRQLRQQLRRADHPEGWLFVDQNGRGVLCRQCPLGAIGHPDALCPRCCTELIHDLHWVFLPCLFYSAPIVTRFCSAEKRLCPLEQTVDPCRFHFSRLCDILL